MDILEEIILNKEKEVSLLKNSFPVEDLLTGIKNKKYIKRNFHESLLEKKTTKVLSSSSYGMKNCEHDAWQIGFDSS